MVLSELIHKTGLEQLATATVATPATDKEDKPETVAKVATVAVAEPIESKTTDLLVICYSPAGNMVTVVAENKEHADWLKRMNPKPKKFQMHDRKNNFSM